MTDLPKGRGGRPPTGKTIVLSDDFIGLKDEQGRVLVDDTAYFRAQREQRPIWNALRSNARLRELADQFREAVNALGDDDEKRQQVRLVQGWIEQVMVSTFAAMLREVVPGEENDADSDQR